MAKPSNAAEPAKKSTKAAKPAKNGPRQEAFCWRQRPRRTWRVSTCPFPTPSTSGSTTYDAKDPNTKYPPITTLRPPKGAPNVLIVLIDDVGFGASIGVRRAVQHAGCRTVSRKWPRSSTAFTLPLCVHRPARPCSPDAITTRWGWVPSPRWPPRRRKTAAFAPRKKAPIAETLKLNGYSTAQFGKCHEVPVW